MSKLRIAQAILAITFLFQIVFPAYAAESAALLVDGLSFKDNPDWLDVIVKQDGNYAGWRIFEGSETLLKELPSQSYSVGDRIRIHFNGNPVSDESPATGKGENGMWDLFTVDTGLTATDNVVRIQKAGSTSVAAETTVDAVIWSNHDGTFTGSAAVALALSNIGHWPPLSNGDEGAWFDSDEVGNGGIVSRSPSGDDTNTPTDWKITTAGSSVTVTNTPTPQPSIANTPSPTPTVIIAAPTLIATNTPTPSPTVAVTATPTPHGVVVTFDQPTVSRVGDSFVVQGNLLGAQSNQVYALKIEGSSSGDTWFDAQTQSPTGEYLAWNASWDNFPTTVINSTSSISFDLRARIRSDRPAGNYQIRIKAKPVGGTNIEVSTVRTIVLDGVLSLTPTPSVVEEPDGDIEEIQTTPVHDAKAMTDGSEVSVSGIVSVVPGLIGPRVFYLQDSTGGIQVQMPTGFNNQIQLGETFEVVGEIHHRSGIVYLNVPNESDVTSQGIVVAVTPQVVAIESLDTDDEGRLVSVEGTVNQVNGNVITLKHGSAELKVQFKEAAFPKRPTIKKGMVAKVVGVLTLSKDELRVLPRTSQDVVVGPNEGGSVLGANGSLIGLPKTGGWAILHGLVTVLCGWFLKRVWVLF